MVSATRTVLLALAAATGVLSAVAPIKRDDDYICGYGKQGIKKPADGSTITQKTDNYQSNSFEIVYCSGQYFKTSSTSVRVVLSNSKDSNTGMVLTDKVKPDNKDAPAGYYSYRFNVSVGPEDGNYLTGNKALTVVETTTGYYNPQNQYSTTETINLATDSNKTSNK